MNTLSSINRPHQKPLKLPPYLNLTKLVFTSFIYVSFLFFSNNSQAKSLNPLCTEDDVLLGGQLSEPYHTRLRDGLVDQYLQLIFEMLNCQLKIISLPAERALLEANRGKIDGDFVLLSDIDKASYPELLKVTPSYFSFFMAYVSFDDIKYEELSSYRIGVITGMPIAAESLSNIKVVRVKHYEQLIELLRRKRLHVAVLPIAVAYYYKKISCLNNLKIEVKPELKVNLYIYLNKRRANLVEPLSTAIENFKHSRKYQELVRKFLKKGLELSAPSCE
ncbi:substrate-binding periplasmic protein [Spartinivicinus poritis]|uniref:Transporter substrate-binding domain-containing protein n=1 Tax=Spartinivicinus poritis TaxID=2994640 RepID=A0ABT5UI28_9GAMM|nr:transporter substrate-binding domain-containing protein [Spartinivicinus sp. A2-2]MDE1464699.1 transporter substrate-binding domain-containing protein [Spartinivicinus sp. A2-2]